MLGYLEGVSEQGLSRRRAKAHDRPRLDELDLDVEPRPAGGDLAGPRLLVNPALAARLPFEMLDHVRHVNALAVDAGFFERPIEELARRADERTARDIFLIARLLANEHDV